MPVVARYWVCALGPALALVGAGVHVLLAECHRVPIRIAGGMLAGIVLCGNALVAVALIDADGRPQPYRLMQHHVASLPPVRNIVFPNHYESRFFGGHYALPNRGRAMFPSIWEEGEEARVKGLKAIWKLVPDAVCYANDREVQLELKQAGIVPSRKGFAWTPSRLMLATYRLKLHPEPPIEAEKPMYILHETKETLAEAAERDGAPVVVPAPGWLLVNYRNASGRMQFGLIAQGPLYPGLQIYIPKSAEADRVWRLDIDLLSYMNTAIGAKIGTRPLGDSHVVRKTAAESLFIPQRKGLPGLPSPDDWVRMGHQFAIHAPAETVTISLGVLAPGWHEVSLDAGRKAAPLILTGHRVGP